MSENPEVSFDRQADALTVIFHDVPSVRTKDLGDGRLLDFDAEGNVIAVEVLGASAGFVLEDLAEQYGFRAELEAAGPEIARIMATGAQPAHA